MRKFVVVNNNKAGRVVCCKDSSAIEIKDNESLVEVDVNRKVRKGEMFYVAVKVAQAPIKKSYWKITVGLAVGAVAAAGAAAYYFIGGM